MHRNGLYIALIIIFSIVLMANSFHRHADLASMAKCPICSGMYVSASTHATVAAPIVIQSVTTALPPAACIATLILSSVPHSLNDRAPPSPGI